MAFTYPASLAGIAATQAQVKASFDNNYAGPVPGPEQPGYTHRITNNPNKAAAIAAYLETETTED